MHVVFRGLNRSNSADRVRGTHPFGVGAAIPMRACVSLGLLLRISSIVPSICVLKFIVLVRRLLCWIRCGMCPEGVGVVDLGLEWLFEVAGGPFRA